MVLVMTREVIVDDLRGHGGGECYRGSVLPLARVFLFVQK